LGFSGKDLIATIDFGKTEEINKLTISFLENEGSWIYFPKNIEILVSNDGINFERAKQVSSEEIVQMRGEVAVNDISKKGRFLKVIATNFGKIPDGNPGAGSNAWLFVDEIGVE
jgi:hexosaminidase